jgi:hypothetical protein
MAAQSGQALWPFKSQIPGSNPGRSTFSLSATDGMSCDLKLHQALNAKVFSYQAMCLKMKRAGLPYHAEYRRQIFGTYLRDHGIEAEIVNILQGRIPPDVFLRHYYRPNFKSKIVKVKVCLDKLSLSIG